MLAPGRASGNQGVTDEHQGVSRVVKVLEGDSNRWNEVLKLTKTGGLDGFSGKLCNSIIYWEDNDIMDYNGI